MREKGFRLAVGFDCFVLCVVLVVTNCNRVLGAQTRRFFFSFLLLLFFLFLYTVFPSFSFPLTFVFLFSFLSVAFEPNRVGIGGGVWVTNGFRRFKRAYAVCVSSSSVSFFFPKVCATPFFLLVLLVLLFFFLSLSPFSFLFSSPFSFLLWLRGGGVLLVMDGDGGWAEGTIWGWGLGG
ncbi:hypothetical protein BZA05DRAFT_253595 [Tricharina praecox]|uniref:uncharacterized protein n=1 Tax=Tricharina praecox TaxID=43433 RepID=UPI00221ED970|nr:uncharacterized protein BZA05DRAFT_253595 [Tricharina praecox]KAI5854924.1 hypothetical protein BZA05DRAFT_253595 [Tricharina praecox]